MTPPYYILQNDSFWAQDVPDLPIYFAQNFPGCLTFPCEEAQNATLQREFYPRYLLAGSF